MNAKTDSGRKKDTEIQSMGRTALRLLVSLAAGGAAGFGISWAVYAARGGVRETAEHLSLAFLENAWIFQTAFFLALTAVSLIFLRKAVASLRKGTDEELDRAGRVSEYGDGGDQRGHDPAVSPVRAGGGRKQFRDCCFPWGCSWASAS